jgi:hypothetical protein
MGEGRLGGLGPYLDLVVAGLQGEAGLRQLDVAVPVAGLFDLDDVGAFLQLSRRLGGSADVGAVPTAVAAESGSVVASSCVVFSCLPSFSSAAAEGASSSFFFSSLSFTFGASPL